MRSILCGAAIAALSVGVVACGENYGEEANEAYANEAGGAEYAGNDAAGAEYAGGASAGATADWPAGSRIVVEEGVTYRVVPDGTRVRLGPEDSRIVVEDGTRFRVDPDGTRFRIDDRGAVISTTEDGVRTDVRVGDDPSVEVNTTP